MKKSTLHKQLQGVAFDVDGTLLTSKNTISPRMMEVCQAVAKNGIHLMIASARPALSVQNIAKMIGANGILCALNGAIIMTADGEIKKRISLPRDASDSLIKRFKTDSRVSLNIYSGADWIVSSLDERIYQEADIIGFMPELQNDLNAITSVEKILLIADDDYAAFLTKNLQNEDKRFTAALSKPGYVEITSSSVDKMRGVEDASSLLGLTLKNFVSCGDGENDITMLNGSGYGIAMGHAPAELKQVASQVVGSNDDDSLAEAVYKIFLSS